MAPSFEAATTVADLVAVLKNLPQDAKIIVYVWEDGSRLREVVVVDDDNDNLYFKGDSVHVIEGWDPSERVVALIGDY